MTNTVLLFSYGTLQLPAVQEGIFGRRVEGEPDALTGYTIDDIVIEDDGVVGLSGAEVHKVLRPAPGAPPIPGVALRIAPDELARADAYETAAYARVEVELVSGRRAFVYVEAS